MYSLRQRKVINFFDMDLNYILLNNIPTSCIRQAHVQGFDCEIISFVLAVNMFERMEIAESIYESVVEPSYKNSLENMPTIIFTAIL